MDPSHLAPSNEGTQQSTSDLERRLHRYRLRLVAEGRTRSLILLERAIRAAAPKDAEH
jgi:hypothetical protein